MYHVILLPLAQQHIDTAAKWYNKQQIGLGKKFTKTIIDKVKFITENPKAIPVRYDETRTAVLKNFPFMIHFVVKDNKNQIIIAAVFHTSLNPSSWKV